MTAAPSTTRRRRAALACHVTDGGNDAVEPLLGQGIEEIEIVHPVAHKRRVEEAEAAQVGQHQVVGLGQEGGHQRPTARGRMVKGELVAQRRLADAG